MKVLSYNEARPYIKKAEKIMGSVNNLKAFVYDYESNRISDDEADPKGLIEAAMTVERIESALKSIEDDLNRRMMEYMLIRGKTLQDTAEKFNYSISSVCRIKKEVLCVISERLFGIIIDTKRRKCRTGAQY